MSTPAPEPVGDESAVGGIRRQLKDTVYSILKEQIVSGELPAGTQLREVELVARLKVSKTPLRDALARLEKDGLVMIPPYRTAVVSGYSRKDLREIYGLRELVEGACAYQAAQYIDDDRLESLAQIVAGSAACVRDGEIVPGQEKRLADYLDQFDQLMYAHSRNTRIDDVVANLRNHIIRIGRLTTRIEGRLVRSVAEHQAIYAAVVRRDPEAAEQLMRRHIHSVLADQLIALSDAVTDAIPGESRG